MRAELPREQMSSVLMPIGNTEASAIQVLEFKIEQAFKSQLQPRCERMVLNRKQQLENEKKQEQMRIERETADAERQKVIDEQMKEMAEKNKEYQDQMDRLKKEAIEKQAEWDRKMREQEERGFWDHLGQAFVNIGRAIVGAFSG